MKRKVLTKPQSQPNDDPLQVEYGRSCKINGHPFDQYPVINNVDSKSNANDAGGIVNNGGKHNTNM